MTCISLTKSDSECAIDVISKEFIPTVVINPICPLFLVTFDNKPREDLKDDMVWIVFRTASYARVNRVG